MNNLSRRQMMVTGLAAIPAAGLASRALAQQPLVGSPGLDPYFAACLLIKGHKQIAVSEFALERIRHADVKNFAHAEIQEHVDLKKKLEALGFMVPAPVANSGRTTTAADGSTNSAMANWAVGKFPLGPGISEAVAIDREVGEQCIATTKSEQGQLHDAKFDKCFVNSQLEAHYGLLDHGVTFKKHASREFGQILDEAKAIIEKHIALLKNLHETLASSK